MTVVVGYAGVDWGADTVVSVLCGAETVVRGVDAGADRVVSVACGTDTVVCGAERVVSVGPEAGDVVTSVDDAGEVAITVVDTGVGLVVTVGDGTPPDDAVAAMATVPAPSTPTVTAAATMAFRDRSTAGIRMGCPLDQRI